MQRTLRGYLGWGAVREDLPNGIAHWKIDRPAAVYGHACVLSGPGKLCSTVVPRDAIDVAAWIHPEDAIPTGKI